MSDFFLSLAEVFHVLRRNQLIMAMTKDGKQVYKFNTQFNLSIFDRNYVIFLKSAIENARWTTAMKDLPACSQSHFQTQFKKK